MVDIFAFIVNYAVGLLARFLYKIQILIKIAKNRYEYISLITPHKIYETSLKLSFSTSRMGIRDFDFISLPLRMRGNLGRAGSR